jgi:hypothetical protein
VSGSEAKDLRRNSYKCTTKFELTLPDHTIWVEEPPTRVSHRNGRLRDGRIAREMVDEDASDDLNEWAARIARGFASIAGFAFRATAAHRH